MKREGTISDIRQLAERLESAREAVRVTPSGFRIPARLRAKSVDASAPRFDQRPGALEATRLEPAGGISLAGTRMDGDKRGIWRVLAMVRGTDGSFCRVLLAPAEARELAAELIDLADVLEGKRW